MKVGHNLRIAAKQEQAVLVCGHRHVAHHGRGLLGNGEVSSQVLGEVQAQSRGWWWAISDQQSAISDQSRGRAGGWGLGARL